MGGGRPHAEISAIGVPAHARTDPGLVHGSATVVWSGARPLWSATWVRLRSLRSESGFRDEHTSVPGLRVRPQPDRRDGARGHGVHRGPAAAHRHLGEGQAAAAAADWAPAGRGRAGAAGGPASACPRPWGPSASRATPSGAEPLLCLVPPSMKGSRGGPCAGLSPCPGHSVPSSSSSLDALLNTHQAAGPWGGLLSTLSDTHCGLM